MTYSINKPKGVLAVILDWAGTSVDHGSIAPAKVFINVFRRHGVTLTIEEVRRPMGLAKRDHVKALLDMPSVSSQWQAKHGRIPNNADIDMIYSELGPELEITAAQFAKPIRGAVEFAQAMRERGIKIGSTTGYVAKMMEGVAPAAKKQGFYPDSIVVPDEVPAARPAPWMIFENARRLGTFPLSSFIKIGDTVADVQEGVNAQTWVIGLTLSGNEVGLSEEDLQQLSPSDTKAKRAAAQKRLLDAGAHYTADGIWDCLRIIDEIDARIQRGERP
ncbi:MAG: phosphonoacetaldehyde hydrolase [Puniceicoccales bacterium]|jgi:phosphonoacetaldehyde hydrolase|nr:phosphonoacetaldehyde hydrolase [Puniceicoccales bacterium]